MNDEVPIIRMSSDGQSTPHGYALWEFTGHDWTLRKDASVAGAMPGKPPHNPGLFKGQIRAVPSISRS